MLFFFASPRILNAPMVKKKESLYAIGGVNKVSKKLPTFNGCQLEKSLPFFFFRQEEYMTQPYGNQIFRRLMCTKIRLV